MGKYSHHMFGVCADCAKRQCRYTPEPVKSMAYMCKHHKKRPEGFKLDEIYRGIEIKIMGEYANKEEKKDE